MSSPSTPVPNDDPACRCLLAPEAAPDGFIEVGFDVRGGAPSRVAYDPRCPIHGEFARALSRVRAGSFSIGVQP